MQVSLTFSCFRRALHLGKVSSQLLVPIFLWPRFSRTPAATLTRQYNRSRPYSTLLDTSNPDTATQPEGFRNETRLPAARLPRQCSGCGAFSQTTAPDVAGYFAPSRRAVQDWLAGDRELNGGQKALDEDTVVAQALKSLSPSELESLGIEEGSMIPARTQDDGSPIAISPKQPLCDRCHYLIHHHSGTPIYHPSVESLRVTLEESTYKSNHVYHVIDAADFPLSFVSRLHQTIGRVALRSHNRRFRTGRFYGNRKIEMSFIITRSDLLAPTKEKVDSLLPYVREVLRTTLGRLGTAIRLGNVRMVSAKRSWWTSVLREELWERGGANWLVGKVNVGKSQLFEAIYPKGRVEPKAPRKSEKLSVQVFPRVATPGNAAVEPGEGAVNTETGAETGEGEGEGEQGQEDDILREETEEGEEDLEEEDELPLDEESMLPPPLPVMRYPPMPTVSELPGTTASPIRIPFGNRKGELIDLPGLVRSDLELFVRPEHRSSLIMKRRIVPEQQTIKPGQSLVLGGGLIRITPRTSNVVFLGYSFTPLEPHVTSTAKAAALQEQSDESPQVERIATPEAAASTKLAGSFALMTDLTKKRSGPITRNDYLAIKVEDLPWRVLSTDILIEGVGWVEVTAQVRRLDLYGMRDSLRKKKEEEEKEKDPFAAMERATTGRKNLHRRSDGSDGSSSSKLSSRSDTFDESNPEWPIVDVYTPEGRFIGNRESINGWMLNKPRVLAKHKRSRPRKSMKGAKKRQKLMRRAVKGDSS